MTVDHVPTNLRAVERGYRASLQLRALIFWGIVLTGAVIVDRLVLADRGFGLILPSVLFIVAAVGVFVAPQRSYRRLGYAIDGRLLRIVRGWLFHTDTVVPFVRVQHIDVTRGPIDKLFGIANLVVHTAGTHNSVVMLPGLSPDSAAAIRDAIGANIRADAE
nr:PH domain-containing protein [uncultured Sphingomonas sp.]